LVKSGSILADRIRPNGRAYTTVFRPSSSVCNVTYVAKWCVLEQKLLLTAYTKSYITKKSIGTKTNDLDLCLEVVRSHVNHSVTIAILYIGNR